MKRLLYLLFSLGLLTLLSGCATTHYFKVDALSAGVPEAQPGLDPFSYVFASPAETQRDGDDLRRRELLRQVERVMAARGYFRVENSEDAALVVSALSSISGPMTQTESFSEPLYWRSSGYHRVVSTPVRAADGSVTYRHNTIYVPPRTEFAGYIDRDRNVMVYEKSLTLSAKRNDGNRGAEEFWTVTVLARDQVSDLRSHLPYMLAAAMPYIGNQTEGQILVRIKDNDPAVTGINY